MKKLLTLIYVVSANVGLVKVAIFMFHKWGIFGLLSLLAVLPVFIAPIWEWIETGSPWTFVFIYVLFLGSMKLKSILIHREVTKEVLAKFAAENKPDPIQTALEKMRRESDRQSNGTS